MTDEEQGRRLVRGFAWYHWLLVAWGAFRGLGEAGFVGILIGAFAMILFVVLLRIVWNEVRLYHRKAVDDAGA